MSPLERFRVDRSELPAVIDRVAAPRMNITMPPLTPEEVERLAHKRASAKLGWYIHALFYVVANLFIFGMSMYAFGHRPWSVFPVIGWGVGLALHAVSVFMLGEGSSFRQRLLERERERLLRGQERGPVEAPKERSSGVRR
jgi:hypothetical protein